MSLLAANDSAALIVVVVFLLILIPLCFWLYSKVKASSDRIVREHLDERGEDYKEIKSSWFPPAKLILNHRKGVLWYTITLADGNKIHARVYMFLTKLVSIDFYD